MKYIAPVFFGLLAGAAVAGQPKGNLEQFSSGDSSNGVVHLYVSDDQSQLYSMHFYENVDGTYWNVCTPPRTERLKISDVKFFWRSEIESFTVSFGKFGEETFHISDMVDLPESRKWILSTLIKKGKKPKITYRGCGSGAITYLVSIER